MIRYLITVQKRFLLACLLMLRGACPVSQVGCYFALGQRRVNRIAAGCFVEGWGRQSVGEEAVGLYTCIYHLIIN